MVICIMPLEQWTARLQTEHAVYLDVPLGIDTDLEVQKCYYGENYTILVDHFVKLGAKLGAKVVDNPVKTYHV